MIERNSPTAAVLEDRHLSWTHTELCIDEVLFLMG